MTYVDFAALNERIFIDTAIPLLGLHLKHRGGPRVGGTVSFTAVTDETVFGPDGAGHLIDQRPDLLGDALICGEGSSGMDLAIAEKELLWIKLSAAAPSGRGLLMRRGDSAITRLAAALVDIDLLNDERTGPPADLACLAAYAGEHGVLEMSRPMLKM